MKELFMFLGLTKNDNAALKVPEASKNGGKKRNRASKATKKGLWVRNSWPALPCYKKTLNDYQILAAFHSLYLWENENCKNSMVIKVQPFERQILIKWSRQKISLSFMKPRLKLAMLTIHSVSFMLEMICT